MHFIAEENRDWTHYYNETTTLLAVKLPFSLEDFMEYTEEKRLQLHDSYASEILKKQIHKFEPVEQNDIPACKDELGCKLVNEFLDAETPFPTQEQGKRMIQDFLDEKIDEEEVFIQFRKRTHIEIRNNEREIFRLRCQIKELIQNNNFLFSKLNELLLNPIE